LFQPQNLAHCPARPIQDKILSGLSAFFMTAGLFHLSLLASCAAAFAAAWSLRAVRPLNPGKPDLVAVGRVNAAAIDDIGCVAFAFRLDRAVLRQPRPAAPTSRAAQ
jgi:hypothetical protein